MTARDVADGKSHGEHRQSESERHSQQPDAYIRESGGKDRAATTTENQPKGSDKLCS